MQRAFEALSPLDQDGRNRAVKWLAETLEVSGSGDGPPIIPETSPSSPTAGQAQSSQVGADPKSKSVTPKQFLAEKSPTTDVERLTCLAYYLTHMRDVPTFNTRDLTDLNTEAAGRRFANAATTGKNATRQSGYLTGAGGRERQITHLGEQVVEALPDRDAVKAVLEAAPNRPRRKPKSRRSKDKGQARKS